MMVSDAWGISGLYLYLYLPCTLTQSLLLVPLLVLAVGNLTYSIHLVLCPGRLFLLVVLRTVVVVANGHSLWSQPPPPLAPPFAVSLI